jgi:hypothetical protein
MALAPYSNIPLQLGKRNLDAYFWIWVQGMAGCGHHGSVFFKFDKTCHKI